MPQITSPCGLGSYTQQNQAISTTQVACRPLYEICTGTESIPGDSRGIQWRDQDVGRAVE